MYCILKKKTFLIAVELCEKGVMSMDDGPVNG